MFYTASGQIAPLVGMFNRQSCLLICNGPSVSRMDWSVIKPEHNLIVAGVNNGAHIVRPHLWFAQDPPYRFMPSIWEDARIMKFTRISYRQRWYDPQYPTRTLEMLPNIWFHRINSDINISNWFDDEYIRWGVPNLYRSDGRKCRTTFLCALGCLVRLGFSLILIAGADFYMTSEHPYFFDEERTPERAHYNNIIFESTNAYCHLLRPLLEARGVQVLNCTPNSRLTAFDYCPLDRALEGVVRLRLDEPTRGKYKRLKQDVSSLFYDNG